MTYFNAGFALADAKSRLELVVHDARPKMELYDMAFAVMRFIDPMTLPILGAEDLR